MSSSSSRVAKSLCPECGKKTLNEGEGHEICMACRGYDHDPLDCVVCLGLETRAWTGEPRFAPS
jgi:hypothetical protein